VSASASTAGMGRIAWRDRALGMGRRNAWSLGLIAFLLLLLLYTTTVAPRYGPSSLAIAVLPLALAAAAQAVVVIGGGIDLSIGSIMAFTSVVAATIYDEGFAIGSTTVLTGRTDELGIVVVVGVLLLGLVLGLVNGLVVVFSRVPDIVVTLAMAFVWAGAALLVRGAPGGAGPQWLKEVVLGTIGLDILPKAAIVLAILVVVVWIPVVRSRIGLSIYAVGSNQLAAFRSGVAVGRTKVVSYMLAGLFASIAGISLTASTGIGTPVPGPYTLMSVAAVVLGGVSLAGGRGGLFGPILAVMILQLIRDDMTFLRINSNLAVVAQGVILIAVVMIGSLVELRRSRA
jgi:ribose transport system permease protein